MLSLEGFVFKSSSRGSLIRHEHRASGVFGFGGDFDQGTCALHSEFEGPGRTVAGQQTEHWTTAPCFESVVRCNLRSCQCSTAEWRQTKTETPICVKDRKGSGGAQACSSSASPTCCHLYKSRSCFPPSGT
jgi:hypothetical protein